MKNQPKHLAMILDGNGRWATHRLLPRTAGHLKGISAITKLIKNVLKTDIKFLTLFIFSTENWSRPRREVSFLIKQFEKYLSNDFITNAINANVKLQWIGFEEKIPKQIIKKIQNAIKLTANGTKLTITFAFNYGGQQDIIQAAKKPGPFEKNLISKTIPPVDLLVRTGNEKRISNFLLFQLAYAEIIFEKKLWPSYTKRALNKNLKEFSKRNRRFGKI